jgi:hypothetical protein
LNASPLRFLIVPAFTPSSQASPASLSVILEGERIVPFATATLASCRHAFASATLGKLLRSFFPSRREKTHASYEGLHVQRPEAEDEHVRE